MRKAAIFCALLAAACGGQKADEASSWIATLQFAGEQWLGNSVPTMYVRATIDSADKALQKINDPEVKDEVSKARGWAQEMRHAIEKNDRAAVATLVKRFATLPRKQ